MLRGDWATGMEARAPAIGGRKKMREKPKDEGKKLLD
jgi:hypothetical protein